MVLGQFVICLGKKIRLPTSNHTHKSVLGGLNVKVKTVKLLDDIGKKNLCDFRVGKF